MFKSLIKSTCGNETYSLISDLDSELADLYLFDIKKQESYVISLSKSHVRQFSVKLDVPTNVYIHNLKTTLKENPQLLQINIQDENLSFMQDNAVYFETTLQKISFSETYGKLLDELLNQNVTLQKKLDESEANKTKRLKEIEERKKFNKSFAIHLKQRENKLFGCFLELLNEKKKRIGELTGFIQAHNENKKFRIDELLANNSDSEEGSSNTSSSWEHNRSKSPDFDNIFLSENETNDSIKIMKPLEPIPSTSFKIFKGTAIESDGAECSQAIDNNDVKNNEEEKQESTGTNLMRAETVVEAVAYSTQDLLDQI